MIRTGAAAALLAFALGACSRAPEPLPTPPVTPSVEVAAAVETTQEAVVESVTPAIVEVREAVAAVLPPPAPSTCEVHPDAVALIVRYEVTSEAFYTSRLQGVIVPPLQSGATWGIGYDGGHQTRAAILLAWADHPAVEMLASTAGLIGDRARAILPTLAGVRTPFAMAREVFIRITLPEYCELAKRTFRNGWDRTPPLAQGALVSLIYNRGASMIGSRRVEMVYIRTVCVPAGDAACIAAQLRLMPRHWVGTDAENGLRNRYLATALLAERSI